MKIFEPFTSETMPNISNITRRRIIDDFLNGEIRKNKNINVITIGAGFDTRPYRLAREFIQSLSLLVAGLLRGRINQMQYL